MATPQTESSTQQVYWYSFLTVVYWYSIASNKYPAYPNGQNSQARGSTHSPRELIESPRIPGNRIAYGSRTSPSGLKHACICAQTSVHTYPWASWIVGGGRHRLRLRRRPRRRWPPWSRRSAPAGNPWLSRLGARAGGWLALGCLVCGVWCGV